MSNVAEEFNTSVVTVIVFNTTVQRPRNLIQYGVSTKDDRVKQTGA